MRITYRQMLKRAGGLPSLSRPMLGYGRTSDPSCYTNANRAEQAGQARANAEMLASVGRRTGGLGGTSLPPGNWTVLSADDARRQAEDRRLLELNKATGPVVGTRVRTGVSADGSPTYEVRPWTAPPPVYQTQATVAPPQRKGKSGPPVAVPRYDYTGSRPVINKMRPQGGQ